MTYGTSAGTPSACQRTPTVFNVSTFPDITQSAMNETAARVCEEYNPSHLRWYD